MGDVAITFKVMPEEMENLEKIKNEIQRMGPKQLKEKDIGFGIKCIDVMFIIPDSQGQKIEEEIKKIPGVASVETSGITLV